MYDIKPLEEEWEKYRKSRRRPYIVAVVAVLLLGAGSAALYYMVDKGLIDLDLDRNRSRAVKPASVEYVENTALTRLEVEEDTPAEPAEVAAEEISDEIVEDLPLKEGAGVRKKPRVKMNIITTEMPTVKKYTEEKEVPHKRVALTIKETSGSSAFKEVAARFRETQDPDDSLFLAKIYYDQGNYKKAAYWALQTNNVDSGIEESILIFAKAKAKSGRKQEATRVLSKYIKQTGSAEAVLLLDKIKKGKI